ncbi:MAG: BamA/TamA family outer membrane protein [Deltaproteobacteria bacterium]|nr:BamA/TamA family outer membrane protein [Deltaproteobacteria bacterium]
MTFLMRTVSVLVWIGCFFSSGSARGEGLVPERRHSPFFKEPAYLALPAPYRLPGIGQGIAFVGMMSNAFDTYADFFLLGLTGDLQGVGGGVADMHLIHERLILDVTRQNIDKATVQNYSQRGMNSDKNEYNLVELQGNSFSGGRLNLTFLERRLEFTGYLYQMEQRPAKIRDQDGNVIAEFKNAQKETSRFYGAGVWLDLTDDYQDPRSGARLNITRSQGEAKKSTDLKHYVLDTNFTLYLPVGDQSTWSFNLFQSDSVVERQGITDPVVVEAMLGGCAAQKDPVACQQVVSNTVARNTYGDASSLGGRSRLRSYPQGRFKGAHTQFAGTELRWNLTEEESPFNFWVMRDVRTTVQMAFFYEAGTVADKPADLGKITRSSAGIGMRMVAASGLVYRFDVATGQEGNDFTLIVGYPWESF